MRQQGLSAAAERLESVFGGLRLGIRINALEISPEEHSSIQNNLLKAAHSLEPHLAAMASLLPSESLSNHWLQTLIKTIDSVVGSTLPAWYHCLACLLRIYFAFIQGTQTAAASAEGTARMH